MSSLVFYILAMVTVVSAGVVVFSNKLIYSAFSLLFTFFGLAGLYVLLGADFIAGAQVLIYVGGILVLLLFGVMLTSRVTEVKLRQESLQRVPSALIVLGVFIVLGRMVLGTPWATAAGHPFQSTVAEIGTLLMTDFLLPFEVVSILLLVALVGAAFIARAKD